MSTSRTWTMIDAAEAARLEGIRSEMHSSLQQGGLGDLALDLPSLDCELWQIGRYWIRQHASVLPSHAGGGDVYLATQLYETGGHTALIGDFVRARRKHDGGAPPHLILTNLHGQNAAPLAAAITSRTEIPAASTYILEDGTLAAKLAQLLRLLTELCPDRLFLFHHPDDPLPSVAAQPELAPQRVLVHHADTTPSFGLRTPGVVIIDLSPGAAPLTRLLGLKSELLLLTAPDPGPRGASFLQRGKLVTATSGSPHKYESRHFYPYAETVGVVLRSTEGWHVHIGFLDDTSLARIHRVLADAKIDPTRFIHVPRTHSVALSLWEHHADVYLASYPVTGARTHAEVLAAAMPHLDFAGASASAAALAHPTPGGGIFWRTGEDLSEILRGLADPKILAEKSRLARDAYEKLRHPEVFAQNLHNILQGTGGMADPAQHWRDLNAMRSALRALIRNARASSLKENSTSKTEAELNVVQQTSAEQRSAIAEIVTKLEIQGSRIDFLQDRRKKLHEKIGQLQTERRKWLEGDSIKSRIARWLLRR